MVFRILHNRKPVPPRDPVCDPISGAISMEQIVKAYLTGNGVEIPEPLEGEYEFPATKLGDNERYRDIPADDLRNSEPLIQNKHDVAVYNTEAFKGAQDVEPSAEPSNEPSASGSEPVQDTE